MDSDKKCPQKKEPINYGEHSYWDERYSKTAGERFQWLHGYDTLQQIIEQAIQYNKQARILHLGCGNSALQDRIYEAGYHHITNVDISSVVIEQMKKTQLKLGYTEMVYEVGDVRKMEYPNESFELVLDKSTIDSLMCSNNPITNTARMLDETYRLLVPNGIYLAVSYASPPSRMPHITREHVRWETELKQVSRLNEEGETLVHFLYICKKLPLPQEKTAKEWREAYFAQLTQLEKEEYPS